MIPKHKPLILDVMLHGIVIIDIFKWCWGSSWALRKFPTELKLIDSWFCGRFISRFTALMAALKYSSKTINFGSNFQKFKVIASLKDEENKIGSIFNGFSEDIIQCHCKNSYSKSRIFNSVKCPSACPSGWWILSPEK